MPRCVRDFVRAAEDRAATGLFLQRFQLIGRERPEQGSKQSSYLMTDLGMEEFAFLLNA
jgi:hypothetical protein